MTTSRTGPGDNSPKTMDLDGFDLANSGPFMDSLVTFLNEASICMRQVKHSAGMSVDCPSSVPMNEEEKREKMNAIVATLSQKCNLELTKDENALSRSKSKCPGPASADLFMSSSSSRHMARGRRGQMDQLFAASSYGRPPVSYARTATRPGAARPAVPRNLAEEYSAFEEPSSRSFGRSLNCSPDCPEVSSSVSRQNYRR